jgi:hypothetical protein
MSSNELAEIALTSDRSVTQHSSNSKASSSTPFFLTPTGLLIRKLVAEFVGVMLMVILIGYVVNAVGNPSMRTARTDATQSFSAALVCYSLVYGLAVATLMGMLAHISGGYFNPALVIGCYAIGTFHGTVFHALFYILAQMAGSVVGASWLLLLPFPTQVQAFHLCLKCICLILCNPSDTRHTAGHRYHRWCCLRLRISHHLLPCHHVVLSQRE